MAMTTYARTGDTVTVDGWGGEFTVEHWTEAGPEVQGLGTYSYLLRHKQTGATLITTDRAVTLIRRKTHQK